MKDISFMKSSPVYAEISQSVLKALRDGNRVEFPLERAADGRLTAGCREKIVAGMRALVNKKTLQARAKVFCAVNAVGVSLRRLSLPVSPKEEFEKVLRLQIEAEFPLSPDELAWGYLPVLNGGGTKRDVLVAAVKKEIIEDYAELFAACDLEPVFTLAALARNFLCPQPGGSHALLDAAGERPEWVVFEHGIPATLRILPPVAEVFILDSAAKAPGAATPGRKIYLAGASGELASQLALRLGGGDCAAVAGEQGTWTAVMGMKKAVDDGSSARLLVLQNRVRPPVRAFNLTAPELKPWLTRAVVLLCVLLFLPLAEALVLRPLLSRKLATLNAEKSRLATIDHEFDFLQSLKQSQPPYLDALYLFAKSAPPGARFDSVNMDRQGDVSLHGTMQNGPQVTDFREKLIASGFFSNVAVEEQSPSPDRQHVTLRMTAHWKSALERAGLATGPTADEIQAAKTNSDAGGPGGGMPMGMPMGMPPGMMIMGN